MVRKTNPELDGLDLSFPDSLGDALDSSEDQTNDVQDVPMGSFQFESLPPMGVPAEIEDLENFED
jgi:hypothetical protein